MFWRYLQSAASDHRSAAVERVSLVYSRNVRFPQRLAFAGGWPQITLHLHQVCYSSRAPFIHVPTMNITRIAAVAIVLASAAFSQSLPFSCRSESSTAPVVRNGGHSELLSEIRFDCTGGSSQFTTTIDAALNFNYGGRMTDLNGNLTETPLILDDSSSPVLGTNVYQGQLSDTNRIQPKSCSWRRRQLQDLGLSRCRRPFAWTARRLPSK